CTYQVTPSMIVYNSVGTRICTSGGELDAKAYKSAPGIDASGRVIAADGNHLVSFNTTGVSGGGACPVIWRSATLAGSPLSSVFDQTNNLVLVITSNGWVFSLFATGASGGTVKNSVRMTSGGNVFNTSNTPCIAGGKIFSVAQQSGRTSNGKMFAYNTIDLTDGWATNPSAVSVTGPSFASPLCTAGYVITDDATPRAIWFRQSDGTSPSFSPVS